MPTTAESLALLTTLATFVGAPPAVTRYLDAARRLTTPTGDGVTTRSMSIARGKATRSVHAARNGADAPAWRVADAATDLLAGKRYFNAWDRARLVVEAYMMLRSKQADYAVLLAVRELGVREVLLDAILGEIVRGDPR